MPDQTHQERTQGSTHADFDKETAYLQDVMAYLRGYHAEITGQKEAVDELVTYSIQHYNSDNAEQFVELLLNTGNQEMLAKKVAQTRYALNKPYFARVDFTPDEQPASKSAAPDRPIRAERIGTQVERPFSATPINWPQQHYIGKMTLMRGLDLLITDWRAPVSSLYYEGRIGSAAYDCIDGHITGEITVKRQYAIEQGELHSVTDIDITTNDEFLQAALGASKDRRLKDIVTTIQAEQNRVIRAPLFEPLVVQGVAGGGKTTIALHRIAYLLYTHEDSLKPRQVVIMAPNRYFLSYISDVLPELGVERVRQTTFEDFASDCIELVTADTQKSRTRVPSWTILPAVHTIAAAVDGETDADEAIEAARLKSRLRFKKLIERYCAMVEKRSAPDTDFMLEGYELFTHEALRDLYLREYAYLPVAKRAAELRKSLVNTLRKEKPLILTRIDADYDERRAALKRRMPDDDPERRAIITAMLNERDEKMKRVRNQSKVIINRYMKRFEIEPVTALYRALFETPGLLRKLATGLFSEEECDLLIRRTGPALAAYQLETEDLPPLLLMQMKLFGTEDTADIKHIVIDEAQDFSLFQFTILKALARNASFSVLGDLHQALYAHRGVRAWEDMRKHVFSAKEGGAYMTLEQSYRTTVEIMDAANAVINRLYMDTLAITEPAVPLAKPVIRHGEAVTVYVAEDLHACAAQIDKKITVCLQEGCRSVAVIGKNVKECKTLHTLLTSKPALVTGSEEQYAGGLMLLPSYLAKGLEFDAVLVANVSNTAYGVNDRDIKLLYIAMTRALHRLHLFSVGEPGSLVTHLPVERAINSRPV